MRSALVSFLFWKMFPFKIRKREKFLRSAGQPIFLVIRPSFFFLFLFRIPSFWVGSHRIISALCVFVERGYSQLYCESCREKERQRVLPIAFPFNEQPTARTWPFNFLIFLRHSFFLTTRLPVAPFSFLFGRTSIPPLQFHFISFSFNRKDGRTSLLFVFYSLNQKPKQKRKQVTIRNVSTRKEKSAVPSVLPDGRCPPTSPRLGSTRRRPAWIGSRSRSRTGKHCFVLFFFLY